MNIGSLAAKTASPYLGAYPASKFPLAAYSQQLRLELAPQGLHVLLVCPGPIRTAAADRLPIWSKYLEETPMAFAGAPQDIANVVAFFASDQSRYITGQSLIVNGGRWFS